MKQIVGILLIILALYLGYTGFTIFEDSAAELNIFGLELDISDKSGKQTAYMYMIGALISFVGGVVLMKGK